MALVNAENAPFFEFVLQILIKSILHYQSEGILHIDT